MITKHTPGPWRVETRKHVHAVKDSNGQDLTYQCTEPQPDAGSVTSRGRSASETFANARLIAAAPDLLAILKKWSMKIDESCADSLVIERLMTIREAREINAVIAKAEGGSR